MVRLFKCKCNHALRYGTHTCSYCFRPTPIYNRWWLPPVLAALGYILYHYATTA